MDAMSLIVGIVIIIGLFFVLREFFLWYWRVSEIASILRRIEENTRKESGQAGEQGKLEGKGIVETQGENYKENQKKVRGYFEMQSRATNDDIQRILGVSDATATRYLEALEKEGLIRQVGGAGRGVYYEKI
ncbi:MAG: hypothetical protein A2131_00985 [Candidatus Sungbacteria bacterium GWC2_49_10]|uniref:HTH deoR-type domain-containing protein n=2 Tax=Parcubacteria group TaxID=1794811 RepID=A0A0G1WLV1_9BACT|nr:MAG: hypothetical protein UY61_C0049G0010 [Candidatus Adlerbacteria bacterium GW2011_GWC1_50_9]OGZ94215.1 MAG: hypothetical protein A2131_00985 [Candidatus Sungbacteria bacterium GWC2_49_10]